MDSKRSHGKPQTTRHGGGGGGGGGSSSSDSSCGSPASPSRSSPAPTRAPGPGGNAFANDGSFMEMFKKKMEEEEEKKRKRETLQTGGEQRRATPEQGQTPEDKKPPPVTSFAEPGKSDAWSKYMAEVKKYKAHQCGDDDKTRPLIKCNPVLLSDRCYEWSVHDLSGHKGGCLRPGALGDGGGGRGGGDHSGVQGPGREFDDGRDAAVGGLGERGMHGGDEVRLRLGLNAGVRLREGGGRGFALRSVGRARRLEGFGAHVRPDEGAETPVFDPGATSGDAVGGGRCLAGGGAEAGMLALTTATECLCACTAPLTTPIPSTLTEGRGAAMTQRGRDRGVEGDEEVET
ncbi:hypothetical protein FQN60_004314 [Etheostoma spectabile]|uniref:Telomerase RNA component interacting RNase n=1 Tax=Etheostoma spectabile TaxID=54343 RepID=A0A5J5CYG3_9PERO|nr:hypothetical protein FQN60_004314 [Etheostoma spectabile]